MLSYGLPGKIDAWQPLDGIFRRLLKSLSKTGQQKWLEDDNIYKWMRTDNQMFTAKERRTLLPHRVGNAYEETARQ